MNNVKVVVVLLLVACLHIAKAGGKESHCETDVILFKKYISQITAVDSNTAKYFNLRYLSQEMKMHGIPNDDLAISLVKYTSSLEQLLVGVVLVSVNVTCTDKASRLVFKINDESSIGKEEYIIVRLVEGKITNVSFEELGVLLDNSEIQSLVYKAI